MSVDERCYCERPLITSLLHHSGGDNTASVPPNKYSPVLPLPRSLPSSSRLIGPQTRKPRIVPEESFNRARDSTELQRATREKDAGGRGRGRGRGERTGKEDGIERERVDATTRKDRHGRGDARGAGERVPILAQSRRPQNERRYYALVA